MKDFALLHCRYLHHIRRWQGINRIVNPVTQGALGNRRVTRELPLERLEQVGVQVQAERTA